MSRLRNIALTVHELQEGEFYWVMMEGSEHQFKDVLPYVALQSATAPQATYSNALVAGVAAIRRSFGGDGPRS